MKTILISTIVLASFAAPAVAQEPRASRDQNGRAEKFRQLPPAERQQIQDRLRQLKNLSDADRDQMKRRMDRFQELKRRGPDVAQRLREQVQGRHLLDRQRNAEANPQRPHARQAHPDREATQRGSDAVHSFAKDAIAKAIARLLNAGIIGPERAAALQNMAPKQAIPEIRAIVNAHKGNHPEAGQRTGTEGANPQRGQQPKRRDPNNKPKDTERRGGA